MRLTLFSLDHPEKENQYVPDYIQVQDRHYKVERVVVDNHQFARCSFERSTLVFSGGPFGFLECDFDDDTTLVTTGPAHRAELLLRAILLRPEKFFPG